MALNGLYHCCGFEFSRVPSCTRSIFSGHYGLFPRKIGALLEVKEVWGRSNNNKNVKSYG